MWRWGMWQWSNPLQWRHIDHDGVWNHQPHGCLLNCLFRRRSKKTPKLRVTGLCVGNSPGPVNSPHKEPVTQKMFPFDDVLMQGWKEAQPRVVHYQIPKQQIFSMLSHMLSFRKNVIICPLRTSDIFPIVIMLVASTFWHQQSYLLVTVAFQCAPLWRQKCDIVATLRYHGE